MKKFLYPTLALSAFFLASCSSEEPLSGSSDPNVVTFTATLPGDMISRAETDTRPLTMMYAVYEVDGDRAKVVATGDASAPEVTYADGHYSVSIPLVHNKTYDFVFFAKSDNSDAYEFNTLEGKVDVNYDKMTLNTDDHDVFFTSCTKTVDGNSEAITLKRPMAQLNIATNDYEQASGVTTTVTLNHLHNVLDLRSGVASGPDNTIEAIHENLEPLSEPLTLDGTDHTHMVKAYVLTGSLIEGDNVNTAASETMDVKVEFSNGRKHEISNVPVRRNNRTNLYGALLSSDTDFTIDIDDEFAGTINNPVRVSTSQALANAMNKGGYIEATDNIVVTDPIVIRNAETHLNVGNNKVTFQTEMYVAEGAEVIISGASDSERGELVSDLADDHLFNLQNNGKLTVENVDITYVETTKKAVSVFSVSGNDFELVVKNSNIDPRAYALASNASNPDQSGSIYFENVVVRQSQPVDGTPMTINIPVKFTAKDCVFEGINHAFLMRGGDYDFTNCEFTLMLDFDATTHQNTNTKDDIRKYRNVSNIRSMWRDGDAATISAVTMGNRTRTSYRYPTNVVMRGCTINLPEVARYQDTGNPVGDLNASLPAVYVYANQEEGNGVTFTYDAATKINGAEEYASPNIIVNGQPTFNYTADYTE